MGIDANSSSRESSLLSEHTLSIFVRHPPKLYKVSKAQRSKTFPYIYPVKRLFLFGFLLLCTCINAPSQELSFTHYSSFKEGDIPIHNDFFRLLSPWNKIYLVAYDQKEMPRSKYYFLVDRLGKDGYNPWDVRATRLDSSANFVALHYSFEHPGVYKVSVLDSNRKVLDSDSLSISIFDLATTQEYYRNGQMLACLKSKDGVPLDTLQSLSLGWEPVKVKLLYTLDEPLKVRYCLVDVWRKQKKDTEAQYLETARFRLRAGWEYMELPYEIAEAGEYTFRLFSEEQVFLGSLQLQVSKME